MPDQNQIQEWAELAVSRAGTYRLLSRVWGEEVDAALLAELLAATFPEIAHFPQMDAAYRRLEKALGKIGPGGLTELAVDYARLCLGSDPQQGADPYESVHRNKEGLLMQDDWEAVLNLYSELGLARGEKTYESEDHLALELEAMAELCMRQAEALQAGSLAEASWWGEQQNRMLDEHLLIWTPSFAGRVEEQGRTEFYKAFAGLTTAYLKMDRELSGELSG